MYYYKMKYNKNYIINILLLLKIIINNNYGSGYLNQKSRYPDPNSVVLDPIF